MVHVLSHPAFVIAAQLAIGIGATFLVAFAPPARGSMLLVPLISDAPAARLALESDALLIGRGPAGTMIVRAERDALFWPLLRVGVLTLAAPAAMCGKAA